MPLPPYYRIKYLFTLKPNDFLPIYCEIRSDSSDLHWVIGATAATAAIPDHIVCVQCSDPVVHGLRCA